MTPDFDQAAEGQDMFDTMVFTKALGALCGALLIFLLASWLSNSLFQPGSRTLPPAFVVDTGEEMDVDVAEGAAPPADLSLPEAFAVADVAAGARVWNQCRACHVVDDTRNSVGPYLQNVVGRAIGAVDGFRYSGALPEGDIWSIENLYAYLENPRGWAPGTSMAFNGLRSQADRVNIIAYLIDNSPNFDPADDPVLGAVDEAALTEEVPEEAVVEAPAEEAVEEEVTEAPVQEAIEEEVAEAPVEEAVEEEVAEAPVEEAVEEDAVAEAPAEEAVEEEVVEAPAEEMIEEEAVAEAPVEEAVEEEVAEAPVEEAIEEEAVAEAPAEEAVEEQMAAAPAEEAVAEEVAEAPAEAATEELSDFAQMVAAGDVRAGQRVWNQCRACHVADQEQNRVGPHLVGLVGRPSNSIEGFRYSGALPDVVWTLDVLDVYLEDPRGFAPGTSMVFNGLRNQQDRANLIAYIESLQ